MAPAPLMVDSLFPAGDVVRKQADFWYQVFCEVGLEEGLLHDPDTDGLVFAKIHIGPRGDYLSYRKLSTHLRFQKDYHRRLLEKAPIERTVEEVRAAAIFPDSWTLDKKLESIERMRFQRGLREQFLQGLQRSYRYLALYDSLLDAEGLPRRLKYLPHIESSFNNDAESHVGALGMWQIMPATARPFLKMDDLHDERREPEKAMLVAVHLLKSNYRWLRSWPLAVTSYNHGALGMATARRQLGTTSMDSIIKAYESPSFGFASRNFYGEFLAISSAAMQADSLFPGFRKEKPVRYTQARLGSAVTPLEVTRFTGLTIEEFQHLNPGLTRAAIRRNLVLPAGYTVRLPEGFHSEQLAENILAAADSLRMFHSLAPSAKHTAVRAVPDSIRKASSHLSDAQWQRVCLLIAHQPRKCEVRYFRESLVSPDQIAFSKPPDPVAPVYALVPNQNRFAPVTHSNAPSAVALWAICDGENRLSTKPGFHWKPADTSIQLCPDPESGVRLAESPMGQNQPLLSLGPIQGTWSSLGVN